MRPAHISLRCASSMDNLPIDCICRQSWGNGTTLLRRVSFDAHSSMGSTRQTLEQLAGSGEWLDGQRFGENPQDGMVEDWVESLNI